MVRRIYLEKKQGFNVKARQLKQELAELFGETYPELAELKGLRILRRYDVEIADEKQFKKLVETVFFESYRDRVFYGADLPLKKGERFFGVEYLPGQYDQRADSAQQCAELLTGTRPRIRVADFYLFESAGGKPLSDAALEAVKKYLINPVDSAEISVEVSGLLPPSLEIAETSPHDVPVLTGFIRTDSPAALQAFAKEYGLAMSMDDLAFCRDYFAREGRDPTLTELRVLDTYWSDHCRHSTFNTALEEIKIMETSAEGGEAGSLKNAYELYEETRREVYGAQAENRKRTLMDMATLGTKALKKKGLLPDLDESAEINACTVKIRVEFSNDVSDGGPANASASSTEPWLLLFKNETHNHPTEIEPFGGAATCLGGAIRDPLAGRAYVHQAMRVTGGGDPRARLEDTLPGKLPQIKIARQASAGYSSYGGQIGLAAGQVSEFYHPGFIAKRMELGAVIGAVPEAWVRREEPVPGDVVILVGGKTGRDGIGGATGSSSGLSDESAETSGAKSQLPAERCPAGNAVEERKLVRLFRKAEVCRLIKRCNDFGAGGVSVAVGELAAGLDINLDAVPLKYPGLDGTELALSESQERMAVVTSAPDAEVFIRQAAEENLEATVIAKVVAGKECENKARLRMFWRGNIIVDLSREFLNTSGAPRSAKALLASSDPPCENLKEMPAGVLLDNLERELAGLRSGSRRGLQERFDGSVGAASVLFPWGGSEQGTPECGMAALLPSLDKQSRTASLMSFGYDPILMSLDPYRGAKGSVMEALAKFACLGGDPFKAWLSFQEYFERPIDGESWGRPAAALLGAFEAQLRLGVPAIGGKDSMSGNYKDEERKINITVPPTLVAFAAGTARAERIRSGALSGKAGHAVLLLSQSPDCQCPGPHADNEWERFKTNIKTLMALADSGALKAAYPVGAGGVAAALALMAFGNMCGVEAYTDSFSQVDPLNYQGSVLAEIDEAAIPAGMGAQWTLAGRTLQEPVFRVVQPMAAAALGKEENPEALVAETPLEVLRRAYEYPLAQVYPQTSTGATVAERIGEWRIGNGEQGSCKEVQRISNTQCQQTTPPSPTPHSPLPTSLPPLVILPVFPGTNGEWDMERAFRQAGAKTRIVVFRNRSKEDIDASLGELAAALGEAQIIALAGGVNVGDNSYGKFIENVLRAPAIADSIMEFLEKRGGLVLGICSGFQALIRTGLVPHGRIANPDELKVGLGVNLIGCHVSRMARTRVMPNNSPWLSLEEAGAVHLVPVSHGEGRVVIDDKEAQALFAARQVPFCYADADGNPSMAEPDNPGGSAFAIEALASPDGRILGKMGHSERYGEFVHINIPGNKRQRIFEAGVGWFK